MIKIEITEEMQKAFNGILNGGGSCAEWCLVGAEKEPTGTFEDGYWVIEDGERMAHFLRYFIQCNLLDLDSPLDDGDDYIMECTVNIKNASILLTEVHDKILCK